MREQSLIARLQKVAGVLVYGLLALALVQRSEAQSANLVRITQPLQISCTAPLAKLNAGTLYVNTCTVSAGSGPFGFSVSGLPKELNPVKQTNAITITGKLPAGHYEYVINFSGAGYSNVVGAYSVDIAPAGTYPSGQGVIRCLQKGSSSGPEAPLCQSCVINSAGVRICDLNDSFRPTGQHPQAPAGARVTSVYMDYAPATFNVDSYALSVSHKDGAAVTKQIAYQTHNNNPAFATQSVPAIDFNWQLVEADGGRWSFNFLPVMQDPLPGMEWGVDFHYNINWQVVPNPKGTAAISPTALDAVAAPDKELNGITADASGSALAVLDSVAISGSSFIGWDVIAAGYLTADGVPGILVQNVTSGVLGIWQVSGLQIGSKLEIGTVPASGWRAVAAADVTGDGVADILLQNEGSGVIEVWQMSGQDVIARTQLSAAAMPGWRVRAASTLLGGGAEIILQDEEDGRIALWTLSNGDVTAKSDLRRVPEAGMRVVALADLTGDRVPDLVLQSKDGKTTEVWQLSDGQVVAKSPLSTNPGAGGAVAVADLNKAGRAGLLTKAPGSGSVSFSQTVAR